MSSSMPPTTHTLPHDQRLRLMRSTRKLEAVLGETPLLVDRNAAVAGPSSFRPRHGRSASMSAGQGDHHSGQEHTVRTATPPRSASLRRRTRTTPNPDQPAPSFVRTRPLLIIDLPASPPPASVSNAISPTTLSPEPASAGVPPSPLTPTSTDFVSTHADATRRRKLAKVVHMLGENVPRGLIFPATRGSAEVKTKASSEGRRRASTLSVPESVRERLRLHAHTIPPPLPAPTRPFPEHTSISTSSSGESLINPGLYPRLRPRPRLDNPGAMYRQELGWSGEWSGGGSAVTSIDDVVRGLRGLRVK